MTRFTLFGVVGMLVAIVTPAQADFGFSFGYSDRPVYRSCAPVVTYSSCAPVYYSAPVYAAPVYSSCGPVYSYAPRVRYSAPRYYAPAPRRSVSFNYYHRDNDRPRRYGFAGYRGERRSAGVVWRR